MRTPAHRLLHPRSARARTCTRRLAAGIALALALGAVCLAFAGTRGGATLTLRQLTSQGGVLMSCAEENGLSTEPLWCADPASPHCIPALPEVPHAAAWHGPVAALWSLDLPAPARVATWITWPRPQVVQLVSRAASQRLERPPRRA
jgi:hypothetical protein